MAITEIPKEQVQAGDLIIVGMPWGWSIPPGWTALCTEPRVVVFRCLMHGDTLPSDFEVLHVLRGIKRWDDETDATEKASAT